MLKQIQIKNYKLFQDFKLENIPQFLLVSGKNNCGKTSFLEAVFLLFDKNSPDMFLRPAGWRGLNQFSNQSSALFDFAYHNFDLSQPIKINYTIGSSKRTRTYKFVPENTVSLIVDKKTESIDMSKQLGPLGGMEISYKLNENQKEPHKDFLKFRNNGMDLIQQNGNLGHFVDMIAFFIPSSTREHLSSAPLNYSELDKLNKTNSIVTSLQIIEPKLKSLSINTIGNRPFIYCDIGLEKKIPLQLMGEGTVRLASLLIAISHVSILAKNKPGMVLVDELENGFHYEIMPKIWEVVAKHAKAYNVQIIATTHSRELIQSALKGIPEDLINNFGYVRIDKEENNFLPKMYNKEEITVALKNKLAIR